MIVIVSRYEHLPTDIQGLHDFCNTPPPKKPTKAASQTAGSARTERPPRHQAMNSAATSNGSLHNGVGQQSHSPIIARREEKAVDSESSSTTTTTTMPETGWSDRQQNGAAPMTDNLAIRQAAYQQDGTDPISVASPGTTAPASSGESNRGQLRMCYKPPPASMQAAEASAPFVHNGQSSAQPRNATSTEDRPRGRFDNELAEDGDELQRMCCEHFQSGSEQPTEERTRGQPAADAAYVGIVTQENSIEGESGNSEGLSDCSPVAFVDGHRRFAWCGTEAAFAFGKHRGALLRDVAESSPGYLRWILETGFAHETQVIVADALMGIFPVRAKQGTQATL